MPTTVTQEKPSTHLNPHFGSGVSAQLKRALLQPKQQIICAEAVRPSHENEPRFCGQLLRKREDGWIALVEFWFQDAVDMQVLAHAILQIMLAQDPLFLETDMFHQVVN